MRKIYRISFLKIIVCFCCVLMFNCITVSAAMTDEAEDYDLGTEYNGHVDEDSWHNGYRAWRYYKFNISEKSYVTLQVSAYTTNFVCSIYNSDGKIVLNESDLTLNTNLVSDQSSGSKSIILSSGTYYLMIEGRNTDFTFEIQAEKQIKLSKGELASLKSNKSGQMTVKCKLVENAIGYRIQYSTDYSLKKSAKTVYSSTTSKIIKGLKKGKRYYVKVCPYTVYDDGTKAYGQNSYVKSVVVKKK